MRIADIKTNTGEIRPGEYVFITGNCNNHGFRLGEKVLVQGTRDFDGDHVCKNDTGRQYYINVVDMSRKKPT